MALKAYTLDLALQTSSEFAIGNTIPNLAGIATDGKGFIPTKNSINKTITLSKGFGKFGGRLFEMTEQTVYSWDTGSADADAYLVIDFTKQNSFKGTIEDGTYEFIDNQSSIVLSDTAPSPSANVLVYKLDGNYGDDTIDGDKIFTGTNKFNKKIIAPAGVQGPIDLSQISVGGRNLLLDTGISFTGVGDGSENGNFDAQGVGKYFLAGGKKVADLYKQYGPSQYLTLSFDWKVSGDNIYGQVNPQWVGQPWGVGIGKPINFSNTNTYGHYTITVSLATDGYSTGDANGIMFRQDKFQGNVTISNVKLEAGNVATDWTPAPEDANGITKTGRLAASGYRPAMNYAYNDFMVQVTLAGGNQSVPVGVNFVLPSEIPAPAMNMTLNLGAGILLNIQADRNVNVSGGNLPGNFFQTVYWVPA